MPLSEKAWLPNSVISFFEKNWETNKNDRQEIQMSGDRLFVSLHSLGRWTREFPPQLCAVMYVAVNLKRELVRVSLLWKQDRNKNILVSGYFSLAKNIGLNKKFHIHWFFIMSQSLVCWVWGTQNMLFCSDMCCTLIVCSALAWALWLVQKSMRHSLWSQSL